MKLSTLIPALLAAVLAAPATCQQPSVTVREVYKMTVADGVVVAVEPVPEPDLSVVGSVDTTYGPTCVDTWAEVTSDFTTTGVTSIGRLLDNGVLSITVQRPIPGTALEGRWAFMGYAVEWDNDPFTMEAYQDEAALSGKLATAWSSSVCRVVRVRAIFARPYHRPDVPRWDAVTSGNIPVITYGFNPAPPAGP